MVDLTHFGAKRIEKKKSLMETILDEKHEGYRKSTAARLKIEKRKRLEEILLEIREDKQRFNFTLTSPLSINKLLERIRPLYKKYNVRRRGSLADEFYLIRKLLEDDKESEKLLKLVESEMRDVIEQLDKCWSKECTEKLVELFWQVCFTNRLKCRQYHFPLVNERPKMRCASYQFVPPPFVADIDRADEYSLILGALDVINDIFGDDEIEADEIERFVNEVKSAFLGRGATGIRVFNIRDWFVLLVLNWC